MRYACPCCDCLTLTTPASGTFDICPVCFWEDDATQLKDPMYARGANDVTLDQARSNYLAYGASQKELAPFVREPTEREMPEN